MTLAGAHPSLRAGGNSLAAGRRCLLPRLPHQAWALAVCALALLLGVAVADDYGVLSDAGDQRAIGEATLRHLAGENGLNLLRPPWNRLYGPVFEVPLALVERILGRDDSRNVYLSRHLLTHLFFVAAGFTGYLLAYRLFGSRWLALFALLLFLLHPRIYAHSFFNSKDVPFLGLFMICLWLAHRAFGKGTAKGSVRAFALCGIAAGLLTNLRIMGLLFVAVVFFMCVCDVVAARAWGERRRAIAGSATFALASVAVYYATMPYLWADPVVRFMEILAVLSHSDDPLQLFQGKLVNASEIPPSYLPVWFGVTTPLLALLLGAVGFAALVWRVATRLKALFMRPPTLARPPRSLLRNTPLRFELLLAACCVLPLLTAFVLRPPLHDDDWRHIYFVWAPFVLLSAFGLRVLVQSSGWGAHRCRLPPNVPTTVATGLAALGLGAIAVEMTRLHPHQHLYFNVLANRPGAAVPLHQRFDLEDRFEGGRAYAHILEELADPKEPDAVFNVPMNVWARNERKLAPLGIAIPHGDEALLRQRDRRRLKFDPNADLDFYVRVGVGQRGPLAPPVLYERQIYGKVIVRVATPDLSRVDRATADAYWAHYRQITSGTPALAGDIDIHLGETAIVWAKESCAPGEVNHAKSMTAVPLDPTRSRATLRAEGVRVGDACLWQAALPDHAFAKLIFPGIGALVSDAHLDERRRRYATLVATRPAARSVFDVYAEDGTLFYVKTACVAADTEAPFFVHVRPIHPGDIPRSRLHRRGLGFDALDFRFGSADPHWHLAAGDIFDDICLATLELPDYPVASVATGQYNPGGTSLWRVDIGEE